MRSNSVAVAAFLLAHPGFAASAWRAAEKLHFVAVVAPDVVAERIDDDTAFGWHWLQQGCTCVLFGTAVHHLLFRTFGSCCCSSLILKGSGGDQQRP